MAEITKRKIASIYSLIAGFFLTLFGGHVHAGDYTNFSREQIESGKRLTTTTEKTTTTKTEPTIRQFGTEPPPTPDVVPTTFSIKSDTPSTPSDVVPPSGLEVAPAPTDSASEFKNAVEIEDAGLRTFVIEKAIEQGKTPENLSAQDFNTLRTDYLMLQVKSLEQQIEQLNQENLPR